MGMSMSMSMTLGESRRCAPHRSEGGQHTTWALSAQAAEAASA